MIVQWRELYDGIDIGHEEKQSFIYNEAADILGVPKRSLEDYMAQLRMGRKFGYDFYANS